MEPIRGFYSSPTGSHCDPIQALDADIAKLQDDLANNPQDKEQDDALLAIDTKELGLEEDEKKIFLSNGNPNQFDQDELQRLVLEKKREDITGSPLTITSEELNNGLLLAMMPNSAYGHGKSAFEKAEAEEQAIIGLI